MDTNAQQNTRVSAAEARLVRQVVDDLLAAPAVIPALSKLMARAGTPHAAPFERYAGQVLKDAGAEQLGRCRSVQLTPPGDGHMARLVAAGSPTGQAPETLKAVEGALNRLCDIADALEDSGSAPNATTERRISISPLGGAFMPDRPGWRSANIQMPVIGRAETPDVGYLNEVDWRSLEHIVVIARSVFQRSILPNLHQGFMGAWSPNGSDWDVRTRLASTLGRLGLPLPFDYAFDCSVPAATAAVSFRMPPLAAFPRRTRGRDGHLIDAGNLLSAARQCYCIRMACLLAAACFGSGRAVEHAQVACYDDQDTDTPAFTCSFSRRNFVHRTLVAIDQGALPDPALRFDPQATIACAAPDAITFPEARTTGAERPDALFSDVRIPPHLDERPLPADLRRLFHARRIRDIDTQHYFGGEADLIDEARLDSRDSLLAAIANLEELANRLEAETAPPDDDATARPLVCTNPLERAAVSLVDDERALSLQAEAFLAGDDSAVIDPEQLPHYFRAPDALLQARLGLSDLYSRLGDFPGAEAQANACLSLAPTAPAAYYQKANVLAQQERFNEAANTLVRGLASALSERGCALLYYHLGLVLWKLDRKRDSAAIQVYAASLTGEYAQKAAALVTSLRKREDTPVIVHASPLAATRDMARARIPIAPSDEARTLVVHAAVGLSCADAPAAAAPYAAALARYFRNDPVIQATARSLQAGCAL